jgi:hypothetical protein
LQSTTYRRKKKFVLKILELCHLIKDVKEENDAAVITKLDAVYNILTEIDFGKGSSRPSAIFVYKSPFLDDDILTNKIYEIMDDAIHRLKTLDYQSQNRDSITSSDDTVLTVYSDDSIRGGKRKTKKHRKHKTKKHQKRKPKKHQKRKTKK